MKEEKVIDQERRKIVSTYTLENNYRVKVSTYHYGDRKAIRSILSECIVGSSGIFTMETHMMFRDLNELVISEPVARYSFKLLEDQHARAVEMSAQNIALLLTQGAEGERECQGREVA